MASQTVSRTPIRNIYECVGIPSSRTLCKSCRPFSASSFNLKTNDKNRFKFQDPWAYNQMRQRTAANVARQAELKDQRAIARGDPIRGVTTPFVESFDDALPQESQASVDEMTRQTVAESPVEPPPSAANALNEDYLGHFLNKSELQESLESSRKLNEPMVSPNRATADPAKEAADARVYEEKDRIAREAVSRIVSLANSSSKERLRANTQRIIETFGRHKTDGRLRPKAPSIQQANSHVEPTPRVGPDTGSSEVQIGILTAKIRVLATRYEGENRNDKVNKRNLRLLLHRRQKLLKYMHRKERGSERWQNMIETLGLTEATWKGQIEVR